MKIILDTDKKTITVPYNYQDKLNEINKMIKQYGALMQSLKPSRASLTRFGKSA